ncbi:MAG: phosphatidate cytidylyltransferase [Alphaproteobacteria bacterium]|nr:phosphatidate cytidylyltransferase [Alphaproteobacteria bacterium]
MPLSPELRTRITSAFFLLVAVMALTLWSMASFAALCLVGGGILLHEWRGLTRHRGARWMVFGLAYIGLAVAALLYLRNTNLLILLAVFLIVWTGDSAAYFTGKRFGRHKIAPAISPGKSWEGLAGSIVASAVMAAVLGAMAPLPHAVLGAVFAVLGLGGDLFESSLKRHAGVKDSGALIPGHGGLFDRVDALLPCAIFAAIALYIRLGMQ